MVVVVIVVLVEYCFYVCVVNLWLLDVGEIVFVVDVLVCIGVCCFFDVLFGVMVFVECE